MAAGMAGEQSAGVFCAVLVDEGSATDKVLGSLGLLVMSTVIHGVKGNPATNVGANVAAKAGRLETNHTKRLPMAEPFTADNQALRSDPAYPTRAVPGQATSAITRSPSRQDIVPFPPSTSHAARTPSSLLSNTLARGVSASISPDSTAARSRLSADAASAASSRDGGRRDGDT